MNKERRNRLHDVISLLDEAYNLLCEIQEEEQESYDNLPESLQLTERGEEMEKAVETMDDWMLDIDTIRENIDVYVN